MTRTRPTRASWSAAAVVSPIVAASAATIGVPVPAFMTALAYYDGYRHARLPANLLQAQRDYFGAHTYERTDKPGTFHTEWLDLRRPVPGAGHRS